MESYDDRARRLRAEYRAMLEGVTTLEIVDHRAGLEAYERRVKQARGEAPEFKPSPVPDTLREMVEGSR